MPPAGYLRQDISRKPIGRCQHLLSCLPGQSIVPGVEGTTPKPARGRRWHPERRLVLDAIADQLGATTDPQRAEIWGIGTRTLYKLRAGVTLAGTYTTIAERLPEISRRLRDVGQVLPRDLTADDVTDGPHARRAAS